MLCTLGQTGVYGTLLAAQALHCAHCLNAKGISYGRLADFSINLRLMTYYEHSNGATVSFTIPETHTLAMI